MDMSRYLALFVEEGQEHVAQLDRELLEAEQSGAQAGRVDSIFRHLHSLKGMAASMQFAGTAELAHALESLVAPLRGAPDGASFSRAQIDLLLQGVDTLRADIAAAADKQALAPHPELLARVRAASTGPAAPATPGTTPLPVPAPAPAAATANLISPALSSGAQLLTVRLQSSCATPALRAYLVHQRLAKLVPEMIGLPPLAELRAGRLDGPPRFVVPLAADTDRCRSLAASVAEVEAVTVERLDAAQVAALVTPSALASPPGVAASAAADQAPAAKPAPGAPHQIASLRVQTALLDELVDSLGELFISHGRLRNLVSASDNPALSELGDQLYRQIRHLYERVMVIRMTPIALLTDKLPRLVRDLARQLGKEVRLVVEGEGVEIDRAVLEALDAPVVHVLRNCLDHGIEPPADRQRAGKPGQGTVRLAARRVGSAVGVEISDDGRGLDPVLLRQAAVARGLLDQAAAAALDDRAALMLICAPGFSTATTVTDVSGRGVGMDVVRSRLEALGGGLDLRSSPGAGTSFTLTVPLSLAIVPALVVRAGRRRFAVPVGRVLATCLVDEQPGAGLGGWSTTFRERRIPLHALAGLLGEAVTAPPPPGTQALVIEDGGEALAIAVERIEGSHELVVKPLGDLLAPLDWLTGASILGDGQPVLILDLAKTLRFAVRAGA